MHQRENDYPLFDQHVCWVVGHLNSWVSLLFFLFTECRLHQPSNCWSFWEIGTSWISSKKLRNLLAFSFSVMETVATRLRKKSRIVFEILNNNNLLVVRSVPSLQKNGWHSCWRQSWSKPGLASTCNKNFSEKSRVHFESHTRFRYATSPSPTRHSTLIVTR